MSTQSSPIDGQSHTNRLRALPSVTHAASLVKGEPWARSLSYRQLIEAARCAIDRVRDDLANDRVRSCADTDWIALIHNQCQQKYAPKLPAVINATGILLHTGLGRAPLAAQAIRAIAEAARAYTPLEVSLITGKRGERADLVRSQLCDLTGAAHATVVNNNAAALLLVLNTLARDREVIVSRGELIEIGGSFRLPEIMIASGARLVEVGTTNKTRLTDYQRAISTETALILKVHPSNYSIHGFAESVSIQKLARLGRDYDVPVIHDIGSGALRDEDWGLHPDEPRASYSLQAGAEAVLFSGDKLLGGPQCGIIAGGKPAIESMDRNPLARALRCDKLALAALSATLSLWIDRESLDHLPLWQLASASVENLRVRARRVAGIIANRLASVDLKIRASEAHLGGGTSPEQGLRSVALIVDSATRTESELARRLRIGRTPVFARISKGGVQLDFRTVFEYQDRELAWAVIDAVQG